MHAVMPMSLWGAQIEVEQWHTPLPWYRARVRKSLEWLTAVRLTKNNQTLITLSWQVLSSQAPE
ncbi:hypothetical protein [Lactiplantibacillus paraplantarum]|uniref:hypothetical protein n=1 Tax=Lactiplantibacillus paraplantarum TaxID=60520 RepID=UPI0020738F3A|nr:hypothetical protein [Lactiplantibacillus paraplantarum]